MTHTRTATGRAMVIAAVAAAVLLAWAVPALAHVEVQADKAQAGATDVTVSFSAEAEDTKAGASAVEVVLPAGIAPSDVSYVSGPTGWTATPTATGLKLTGPVRPIAESVDYKIKIAKLPVDATSLPFKTLVTYGDGTVDRWIDIPVPGQAEPDHPAPVLTLTPAAATTATPTPAATTPAVTPTTPLTTVPTSSSGGSSPGWWIALIIVVVLAIGGGAWWIRRRGRRGDGAT